MARTETKMMGLSFGGEWMPVLKYSVKWCSICIVCATNCHLAWREGGESLDFFFGCGRCSVGVGIQPRACDACASLCDYC
jgi:hypothetical protein